ncbi:MAG: hypothetical protein MUP17_12780 [candidate division Zixibacteria bacterium]|nr:hypothetical protein [candidate division Zixibacteria bacterium]
MNNADLIIMMDKLNRSMEIIEEVYEKLHEKLDFQLVDVAELRGEPLVIQKGTGPGS